MIPRAPAFLAVFALAALPSDSAAPTPYPEAIAEVVSAEEAGKWEEALAAAKVLLDEADARELTEYQRAEVHFAIGVTLARRKGIEEPAERRVALTPFESARALAGPGALRLDAGYDLGVVELLCGEDWRVRIPELGGQPPMTTQPAPDAEEDPPDPLEEARAAYLAAKERLIERLRADWRDEDTRANLELIQRRLHELDEIERQREEQQQDPNQQQDGEGEEGDESEEQEGQPGEGEESKEDQETSEDEQESDEDQSGDESTEEGEQETSPLETGDQNPEESATADGERRPAERRLTREEVMRLLEALEGIEERGEELKALLQKGRRVKVERDW